MLGPALVKGATGADTTVVGIKPDAATFDGLAGEVALSASCTQTDECGPTQFCAQGQCTARVCAPNATKCAGDGAVSTCAGDGSGWINTPCGGSQFCADGFCQDANCQPSETICKGNQEWTCSANGGQFELTTDCGAMEPPQICGDGACAGAACGAGDKVCVGLALAKVCSDDGTAWIDKPCGPKESCLNGDCTAWQCAPNKPSCFGSKVVACSADGLDGEVVEDCAKKAMSCANGACAVLKCVPGATSCQSGELATCGNDGKSYLKAPCPTGKACDGGKCLPQVCVAATKVCQGQTAAQCNATGTGFDVIQDCGKIGQSCTAGKCVGEPICTPGAKECDGSKLKTCASDGLAWAEQVCDDGDPCTAGEWCTQGVCQPGVAKMWAVQLSPTPDTIAVAVLRSNGTYLVGGGSPSAGWRAIVGSDGSVQASLVSTAKPNIAVADINLTTHATLDNSGQIALYTQWAAAAKVYATPQSGPDFATLGCLEAAGDGGVAAGGKQAQQPFALRLGADWQPVAKQSYPGSGAISAIKKRKAASGFAATTTANGKLLLLGDDLKLAATVSVPGFDTADDTLSTLATTGDGGCVVAGTHPAGAAALTHWVAKLTAAGAVAWKVVLPGTPSSPPSLDVTPNGAVLLVRDVTLEKGKPAVGALTLLSQDGAVVWSRTDASAPNALPLVLWSAGGLAVLDAVAGAKGVRLRRTDEFGNFACTVAAGCGAKAVTDCNDGNACTWDLCESGACLNKPAADNFPCSAGNKCSGGVCKP